MSTHTGILSLKTSKQQKKKNKTSPIKIYYIKLLLQIKHVLKK